MATETGTHNILGVMIMADEMERRFIDRDVQTGPHFLQATAETYVREYVGTFEFLVSLREALGTYGYLSFRQAAGALNCIVADERRKARAIKQDSVAVTESVPGFVITIPDEGTYTVVLEDETYVTLRVSKGQGNFEGKLILANLIGPDNGSDYAGFGHIMPDGTITYWRSRMKDPGSDRRAQAVSVLIAADVDGQREAGRAYAMKSGNCWKCGRELTTPESIAAGIGPICAGRL